MDSKQITVKSLSEHIDIHGVQKEARNSWDSEQRKRRRVEHWLIRFLPFGMVVMVLIFYGLSAPHTAHLLSLITPTFVGQYLAPVGWELGVLIVSALREAGLRNWLTASIMWILLILSIFINIAGGFIAVVSGATEANLQSDTLNQLFERFGDLPATYQVVLILVPFVGAVIPIIAKLAGEAVVKLALGKVRLERDSDEDRWMRDAARVMYTALLQEALKRGAGAKTAANWAQVVTDEMYRFRPQITDGRTADGIARRPVPIVLEPAHRPIGFISPPVSATGQADGQRTADNEPDKAHGYGQGYTRKKDARTIVREHLKAHPEDISMRVRDLAEKLDVGKTTVSEVIREFKE